MTHVRKHTILITEDDEPMRLLLDVLLKNKYDLVFKKDGLAGMKWLSEGNIPSVIMSDFMLPKMNGFDLLNSLSQSGIFSDIPFIMLSSRTDKKFKDRCFDAGAKGFLDKPFDPSQLYELLNRVLRLTVEN
ncbi:Response regulator receiver domain-containing protein [Marivirga sericea]|uniref:Response regulator receiver domain-containing protein n=1 Tax=Marivirga sericea TaxID=1028 RepID=A0A1X7KMJ9_9BACT|nr:response regulator [Marivirga sericea]SMG41936.1 Response regulator receiver domain-containing protein [Marivirga sericea]